MTGIGLILPQYAEQGLQAAIQVHRGVPLSAAGEVAKATERAGARLFATEITPSAPASRLRAAVGSSPDRTAKPAWRRGSRARMRPRRRGPPDGDDARMLRERGYGIKQQVATGAPRHVVQDHRQVAVVGHLRAPQPFLGWSHVVGVTTSAASAPSERAWRVASTVLRVLAPPVPTRIGTRPAHDRAGLSHEGGPVQPHPAHAPRRSNPPRPDPAFRQSTGNRPDARMRPGRAHHRHRRAWPGAQILPWNCKGAARAEMSARW